MKCNVLEMAKYANTGNKYVAGDQKCRRRVLQCNRGCRSALGRERESVQILQVHGCVDMLWTAQIVVG